LIERRSIGVDKDELGEISVPDQVMTFLVVHRDRAFKATEIARQLDPEPDTVSTALTRLKKRDLVEHKSVYGALMTDADRLQSYDGYERATQRFNKQLGTEDKADWEEHTPAEPLSER
jgi:Mn-dependent DtxR family transcriptional regulator